MGGLSVNDGNLQLGDFVQVRTPEPTWNTGTILGIGERSVTLRMHGRGYFSERVRTVPIEDVSPSHNQGYAEQIVSQLVKESHFSLAMDAAVGGPVRCISMRSGDTSDRVLKLWVGPTLALAINIPEGYDIVNYELVPSLDQVTKELDAQVEEMMQWENENEYG